MESNKNDFLSDLAVGRSLLNAERLPESLSLNEMQTRSKSHKSELNADDLFNSDTHEVFGLVPENASGPDRDEETRQQKDLNHLSCESITKLSDGKLEKMSIQALNKQFRHLPEWLVQRIRKRRRILKNRKYALKCRKKGSEKTDNITEENTALELEIFKAKEELRKVTSERDEYKLKYVRLSTMLIAWHSKQGNGAV